MQNQQVAAHPQAALQEPVQPVTKVQYPCGEIANFVIFPNVKIRGEINIHAAAPNGFDKLKRDWKKNNSLFFYLKFQCCWGKIPTPA